MLAVLAQRLKAMVVLLLVFMPGAVCPAPYGARPVRPHLSPQLRLRYDSRIKTLAFKNRTFLLPKNRENLMYRFAEKNIGVEKLTTHRFSKELGLMFPQNFAILHFASVPVGGATVFVEDESFGITPESMSMLPGKYTYKIMGVGCDECKGTVVLLAGEERRVTCKIAGKNRSIAPGRSKSVVVEEMIRAPQAPGSGIPKP
jgi:hypothetical protein